MAKQNIYRKKTYVTTAAQGIQAPYSANMYGREPRRGQPNIPLIKNIDKYVKDHEAELQICSIAGSYVNEIELDPFFHKRDDVYIGKSAKRRNEQNKNKEIKRREAFEERKEKWQEKHPDEPVYPYQLPMHYFWDNIPDTNYKPTGTRFNSNVRSVNINTAPQNKNPLLSKSPLTQKHRGNSIIVPSPKRRLKAVASGQSGEYPKIMMTTGACTYPSYNTSNDRGETAYEEHKYGFGVVDVLDDKIFLPRIVPAQKNGTFIDQGIKYQYGRKPVKVGTTALILGDLHVAEINPKVDKANLEMMEWFQPKFTYVHDAMDADTISHWQLKDFIHQMNKFHENKTDLEEELYITGMNIKHKAELAQEWKGKIYLPFDNHGDFVYRWLTSGAYIKDRQNAKTAFRILAQEGLDKFNTIEKAIKTFVDIPNNVTFLKPGEDMIHWGYQCAAHGHLGTNGSRGSLKNLIEGFGKIISGHSHQLEVIGDSMSVGTSSKNPMRYQLGQPSTSMAGNVAIYNGGLAQALPVVKGKWAKENFASVLDY